MCVSWQGRVQCRKQQRLSPFSLHRGWGSEVQARAGRRTGGRRGERGALDPQAKSSLCSSCKRVWHTGHCEGSKGWMVQELAAASPIASAKIVSSSTDPPFSSRCCRKSWPGTEMEARAAATAFSGWCCAVRKTPVKLLLSCYWASC